MMADPKVVKNPRPIETMTYRELRELSYMGASVLHEDAVFPAKRSGIPIRMLNTKRPQDPGTLIVPYLAPGSGGPLITGIAGKKGFYTIALEKDRMSTEADFLPRVLEVLLRNGVSFEHVPSGIDTLSIIVAADTVKGRENLIYRELTEAVNPDGIEIKQGPALLTVVGRNMAGTIGTLSRVTSALAGQGITVRMIDQGSDELNIIIGVDESCFEQAMNAIYREFVSGEEKASS
jgi:aspartate kinase